MENKSLRLIGMAKPAVAMAIIMPLLMFSCCATQNGNLQNNDQPVATRGADAPDAIIPSNVKIESVLISPEMVALWMNTLRAIGAGVYMDDAVKNNVEICFVDGPDPNEDRLPAGEYSQDTNGIRVFPNLFRYPGDDPGRIILEEYVSAYDMNNGRLKKPAVSSPRHAMMSIAMSEARAKITALSMAMNWASDFPNTVGQYRAYADIIASREMNEVVFISMITEVLYMDDAYANLIRSMFAGDEIARKVAALLRSQNFRSVSELKKYIDSEADKALRFDFDYFKHQDFGLPYSNQAELTYEKCMIAMGRMRGYLREEELEYTESILKAAESSFDLTLKKCFAEHKAELARQMPSWQR